MEDDKEDKGDKMMFARERKNERSPEWNDPGRKGICAKRATLSNKLTSRLRDGLRMKVLEVLGEPRCACKKCQIKSSDPTGIGSY
jgi:hypothetical protein